MTYQHILVPIDGSELSFSAIQHAASIAQACQSKLTFIQALLVDPIIMAEYTHLGDSNTLLQRAHKTVLSNLERAQQQSLDYGIQANIQIVEGHTVHREILNYAQKISADLIVMGSHGHTGLKKLLLGSVAQNLITESPIPVLITGQSTST